MMNFSVCFEVLDLAMLCFQDSNLWVPRGGKSHVSCLGPSGNEARASLEGKLFAFNTFAIQAFCEVSQESDATGLQ